MINSNNLFCGVFICILLIGARQPTVEGAKWILGGTLQFELVNNVVNLIDKLDSIPSNDTTRMSESFEIINQISSKLKGVSHQIAETKKTSLEILYRLKHFIQIQMQLGHLQELLGDIQSRYQKITLMTQNITSYDNITLKKFAEENLNHSRYSIDSKLFDAFETYFGDEHQMTEYFTPLVNKIAVLFGEAHRDNMCHMISVQQLFYNDYFQFTILEFQGHLIKKFSEIILFYLKEEELLNKRIDFRRLRDVRTLYIIGKFHNVIGGANRELWKCDPQSWKEKENFEQLTRLIQGYVVNEASIADSHSCYTTCHHIKNMKLDYCFSGDPSCDHCAGTGKLISCDPGLTGDIYTICPSTNPARRYEHFETNRGYSENNKFYGRKGSCPNNEVTVKSWIRGFYSCSYCFCYIDENNGRSDRFFSLLEVLSDVDKNMVVTGIKFVKVNRVIHLQIQQGELAPFGMIKPNTTKWKDVEKFKTSEKRDGIDYVTLGYDRRSVNLDNVETANSEYIVTGVKLSISGSRLFMEVQISKYIFELGTLIEPEKNTQWIRRDPQNKRSFVPLRNRGIPTHYHGYTPTPSKYNAFQFTHSGKDVDAAQTTLPFIDSQGVTASTPTPLSGAGLYHKGSNERYGGFLAPKIFTLNIKSYIL